MSMSTFSGEVQYLRTLFIHGARSVLRHLEQRPDQAESWLKRLMLRRGKNVAAVALANKNARIAWALLAHQREFEPDYASRAPSPLSAAHA
jgi:transposase